MDPITLSAIIGGGSSLVGGLMGASAQEDAANKNWQINLLNYYQRQKEHDDAVAAAQQMQHDQKLGSTDSRGNHVHFVPGQGWVTDLSDTSQEIQNAQDAEQLKTLNQDLPAQRQQMFANIRAAMGDRFTAQGIQDQMKRPDELTSDTQARYRLDATRGGNQQFDALTNSALNEAMRTGNMAGAAQIIQRLAGPRAQTGAQMAGQADLQGEQAHDAAVAGKQSQLANLYNLFATRGAQSPKVSYKADNITGNADAQMDKSQSIGNTGDSAMVNASARQAGTLDYIQPQMGLANSIVNAGQTVSSDLDNAQWQKMYAARNAGASSTNGGF